MKIRGFISLDLSGCEKSEEIEIDDAEMEGMSEQERKDYIYKQVRETLYQYIDTWYEVVG